MHGILLLHRKLAQQTLHHSSHLDIPVARCNNLEVPCHNIANVVRQWSRTMNCRARVRHASQLRDDPPRFAIHVEQREIEVLIVQGDRRFERGSSYRCRASLERPQYRAQYAFIANGA